MVSIAVFLLVISSGSVLGVTVWKRRFTEMLPVSCSLIVLLCFIAGLAGKLKTGAMILPVLAGGAYLYAIWHAVSHRDVRGALKRLGSIDTVVFAVLALLSLCCDRGMEAVRWDEFSHWMDTVKTMTLIHDLGTNPEAHVIYPSYPPGLSLFHYPLQEIYLLTGGTEFSEWRYLFSYKLFSLCMIAPVFRKLSLRKPLAILFAIGSTVVFPGVFFEFFYDSGLVDAFLGLMSGAGLAYLIVYDNENDRRMKRLSVCAAGMILVLTKDAGLLFAVMLLVGVFVSEYLTKNSDSRFSRCIFCLETAAAIAVPKIAWNLHLKARGVGRAFHNPIVPRDLVQIVLQRDESWRQEAWNQYFRKLVTEKVPVGSFHISFFLCFLFFLGIAMLTVRMLRRGKEEQDAVVRNVIIIAFFQLVIYVVGLGVEYLFQFSEYEGSIHASFARYIGVAFLGILIVLQAAALKLFAGEGQSPRGETAAVLIALSVVLLLAPMSIVKAYLTRETVAYSYEFRRDYDRYCMEAEKLGLKGNGWLITQHYQGAYYKLKCLLKPFQVQRGLFSFRDVQLDGSQPDFDVKPEEWMDQLCEGYDYVLLYKTDDYFSEHYGYLFEEPEEIADRTFFVVDRENRLLIKLKVES